MEDLKYFVSFVHEIRGIHSRDGADSVAPPSDWSDPYFPLRKATKTKWRELLPQPPLVSWEVFEKVEAGQGKVRKNESLINQGLGLVCDYSFVSSQAITTVGARWRLYKAFNKAYRSVLGLPCKIYSSIIDAFDVPDEEVAF